MNKSRCNALSAAVFVFLSTATPAALVDNGGGLIYDDVRNITWLADANYAMTSLYDADGVMTWYEAVAWANTLNYGDQSGWRLPTAAPCSGDLCNGSGSEMDFLFLELAGNPGLLTLFSNIQGNYWSGTERDTDSAWVNYFTTGDQSWAFKGAGTYAWAVHAGNIATPIPPAILLFGSGLLGLVGIARRKKVT